eukprot:7438797-Lingulodinium_polyedra.AAC.1
MAGSNGDRRVSWADTPWENGARGSWECWTPRENDSWEVVPWSPTPQTYGSPGNVWESHAREGDYA